MLTALLFFATSVARAAPLIELTAEDLVSARAETEVSVLAEGSTWVAGFIKMLPPRPGQARLSEIRVAVTQSRGQSWSNRSLPGIILEQGGKYDRVADPSVAYSRKHKRWMISTIGILPAVGGTTTLDILVSLSDDGAQSWTSPRLISSGQGASYDKNWTTCDNFETSPYFGHCYTTWSNNGGGYLLLMSASSDGGKTWSEPVSTPDAAYGMGGTPLILSTGRVVIPYMRFRLQNSETAAAAIYSDDGGRTWSRQVVISPLATRPNPGGIRTSAMPSASVSRNGDIFVAWPSCQPTNACAHNTIQWSKSTDGGETWSRPVSLIDLGVSSEAFIPSIATTPSGGGVALMFHVMEPSCAQPACRVGVSMIRSLDSGRSWSSPLELTGPTDPEHFLSIPGGRMVGDYNAILAFDLANGFEAFPFFARGAPRGDAFSNVRIVMGHESFTQ